MTSCATPAPRHLVRPVLERSDLPPPLGLEEGLAPVIDLLERPGTIAITGAGLSTESGIPDYRGPTGRAREATPMTYQEFVSTAAAQRRYWARSYAGWPVMGQASPNPGHTGLAALQRHGALRGLVTQNVDRLHKQAGSDPLVELHGSLERVICLNCRVISPREQAQERLTELNPDLAPQTLRLGDDAGEVKPDGDLDVVESALAQFRLLGCLDCGGGPLKPDVVFFGESVPAERVQRCLDWVESAPGVIVLGSSLAVMSAYRFVRQAARAGKPVIIVNQGPTRGDGEASVRISAPLGDFVSRLVGEWRQRHPSE